LPVETHEVRTREALDDRLVSEGWGWRLRRTAALATTPTEVVYVMRTRWSSLLRRRSSPMATGP